MSIPKENSMNSIPKLLCLLLLFITVRTLAAGQSHKQNAEKFIASCYATDFHAKGCTPQSLLRDGTALLSLYKAGDTSVLTSLMRVNALSVGLYSLDSKFFAHAMQDNLDGFLSALSSTQDSKDVWRNSQAISSACDCPGIGVRQFTALREKLRGVANDSPLFDLAQECRKDLEDANATLIYTYFPPNTFKSRAGEFTVHWYSGVLYALDEKPLWPPDPKGVAYRFLWMRSFHDQVSITMEIQEGGGAQLRLQVYKRASRKLESRTLSLTKAQVEDAVSLIEQAGFWNMTTEGEASGGMDGAEWVLEGVQNGQYHIVTRWDASRTSFGRALLELLQLSNYNPPKAEIY